jgi:hypothetical protein
MALLPADQADFDHAVEAARAALGAPRFAALWAAGRELSLTQAMAIALSDGLD